MNSADLILALRMDAFINDVAFPDYDDARCLTELTNALHSTFERQVVTARCGYWLRHNVIATTVGRAKYRIPARACFGGLESVAIGATGGPYRKLEEVTETHAQAYEYGAGSVGDPQKYVVRGDQVVLLPTPQAVYSVRMAYYLRPSRLTPAQTAGQITNVNPTTRVLTIASAMPLDYTTTTGTALVTAQQRIDVVHPTGWCEAVVVNVPQTFTGLNLTVGGTDPIDEVEVGDYVRVANQSDWPAMPEDFHRLVADVAALKVMTELHMGSKAQILAPQVAADLERFNDTLTPRVRAEAKVLKAPRSILQAGRGRTGFWVP